MKKFIVLLLIIVGIWFLWQHDQTPEIQRKEADLSITMKIPDETEVIDERVEIEVATEAQEEIVDQDAPEAFFYNQLEVEMREIYRLIRDGVAMASDEIIIDTDDIDLIHDIYRLVLFDHPEFFWVTGAAKTTITTWSDGRTYATFRPDYAHVGAEKIAMQAEIEAVVDHFLATLDPTLSDYELVRVVYEYLIRNTVYDLDAPDHQNIYSVFVNRASVCAGISRAAQLLLNRLGIFATYVVGDAYVPGSSLAPIAHAWNLVRINGEYYYLDVTWGMPTFGEDSGLAGRIDVIYDYLLLTGEMIYRTHTLAEGIIMPEVNSLTHTFFYLNNMFYDSNNRDLLLEAMNTSISNGEDRTAFQFATSQLFEEMREVILEELAPIAAQNLMEWHGLSSTQYFFRERENLNKITIYWIYE